MDARRALIKMLQSLLGEMNYVQSQGAGYYTCSPFALRYNKLLEQSGNLFRSSSPILATFEPLDELDPKDPADKSKRLLTIRIEVTQLITLLETLGEEETA